MLTPGKINRLTVCEILPFGVYAKANLSDENAVLVPYEHGNFNEGDCLEAFVYYNEEKQLQGVIGNIKIQLGEYQSLKVKKIINAGAFVDWGLKPDLFMPREHMHSNVAEGLGVVCSIFHDPYKNELLATSKVEASLGEPPSDFDATQPVNLLLYAETPLGFKAIVNHRFGGLLYKNELAQRVRIGQTITGYVKTIRPDGKVDLCLRRDDKQSRNNLEAEILDDLVAHGGLSSLTDKSSPDDIQQRFNVSKGAYKKAIGALYKAKKITIQPTHIRLVEK